MEILSAINILDLLRPDKLGDLVKSVVAEYHLWVYLFLFLIVFCETGLVVTPFLPGDSLLFVAGWLAAGGGNGGEPALDLRLLLPILCLAPLCGDNVNYWIGRVVGPKIFHKEKVRFLNRQHLDRAHEFYQRHGGKAVAIGRFLPIIRTFVPFVAGIGKMDYRRFVAFSFVGTLAWINLCILSGYYFGNQPFIQRHFEMVVAAIIVISMIPAVAGYLKSRKAAAKAPAEQAGEK